MAPRPLEQVLDELEQRRVRPLHVLEDEDRGLFVGEPLEEQPPRTEEVLALLAGVLFQAQELGHTWLRPLSLVGVRSVLG